MSNRSCLILVASGGTIAQLQLHISQPFFLDHGNTMVGHAVVYKEAQSNKVRSRIPFRNVETNLNIYAKPSKHECASPHAVLSVSALGSCWNRTSRKVALVFLKCYILLVIFDVIYTKHSFNCSIWFICII